MKSLLDLPLEIQADIISYLPTEGLLNCRLVCHNIERAALNIFGKQFFRKIGFLLTSLSLSRLRSIAQHAELRKYVQHVWFNPDFYTFVNLDDEYNTSGEDGVNFDYRAYQFCIRDHQNSMEINHLSTVLTSTIRLLPNIKTLGMRRGTDHTPCGWQKYSRTIGRDPRVLGDWNRNPCRITELGGIGLSGTTRLLIALINAMAVPEVNIHRLYTDAVELDSITPQVLPQVQVNEALKGLLYLEVNTIRTMPRAQSGTSHASNDESVLDWGGGLVRLLAASPRLKELGLQVFPNKNQDHLIAPNPHDSQSWLDSYPFTVILKMSSEVRLCNLTRIKLEKFTTHSQTLEKLLMPCKDNLSSLKLRHILLLSDSKRHETEPWAHILSFLRSSCSRLSYLLLDRLKSGATASHLLFEKGTRNPGRFSIPSRFPGDDKLLCEAKGLDKVKSCLEQVLSVHDPARLCRTIEVLSDNRWYTDTSDEEW